MAETMPAAVELPPSVEMFGVLLGSPIAEMVHLVVEADVPDLLKDGPRTSEQLAAATGFQAPGLARVLRALTNGEFFTEPAPDTFALGRLGRVLTRHDPSCARDVVRLLPWLTAYWAQLPAALRSGRTAFEQTYGTTFFEYLGRNPEVGAMFDRAMTAINAGEPRAVAESLDFSDAASVVDVGGGRGSMLATVLRANPHLRGVLFDLPAVAERDVSELADLHDRCEIIGGDFFDAIPAGHDRYVLSHIVHDWDDERALRILRNCRTAMNQGGRVLIVEGVLERGGPPHPVKMLDSVMLATTGGGERTEQEFRDLLAQADLSLERIIPTPTASSLLEAVGA